MEVMRGGGAAPRCFSVADEMQRPGCVVSGEQDCQWQSADGCDRSSSRLEEEKGRQPRLIDDEWMSAAVRSAEL